MQNKKYIVSKDGIKKADHVVKSFFDVPRSKIRAFFQHGCVSINGETCYNPGTDLREGDELEIRVDANKSYKELQKKADTSGFDAVYEDGHLIVVDKYAGMLTVPTSKNEPGSLVDNLRKYVPRGVEIEVVHRLDRETSGLLVFAKSKGVAKKIKKQFEDRKPERVYNAFVRGVLSNSCGTYESYLATDIDLNQYSLDKEEAESTGKLAITHYELEKQYQDFAWVKVKLETGRRNQIRVHFSENNHPVLGDKRYRKDLSLHPSWKSDYLALHASTLGFYHPVSSKKMFFKSELPKRMLFFLKEFGE